MILYIDYINTWAINYTSPLEPRMEKPVLRLTNCPSCAQPLRVSRLECPHCQISIEGTFTGSRLGLLPPNQQEFVEVFLSCGGSIKAVEEALGISYPTVKKKLEEVVQALGTDAVKYARMTSKREEILKGIENGVLSAKQGAKLLKGS